MTQDETIKHIQEILKGHIANAAEAAAMLDLPGEIFVMELYKIATYMAIKMGINEGMPPAQVNSFLSGFLHGLIESTTREPTPATGAPQ